MHCICSFGSKHRKSLVNLPPSPAPRTPGRDEIRDDCHDAQKGAGKAPKANVGDVPQRLAEANVSGNRVACAPRDGFRRQHLLTWILLLSWLDLRAEGCTAPLNRSAVPHNLLVSTPHMRKPVHLRSSTLALHSDARERYAYIVPPSYYQPWPLNQRDESNQPPLPPPTVPPVLHSVQVESSMQRLANIQ